MPLPHASRHTVLAVEDDDLIRSLLDDTLCDLGYRTITAANGQEALAALQAHQDIDLLVTDVRMPLLNGVDLVAQARQAQPGLRDLCDWARTGEPVAARAGGRQNRTGYEAFFDGAISGNSYCND